MIQPKKSKFKKEFRGSMSGISYRGSKLAYGDFGLQALECGWIQGKHIEAARKVIVNHTKRRGKTWIKVFPHKPVTAKSAEVTRGGGKGEVSHHVAVIRPGLIVFEIGGLPSDLAMEALKLASQKLPLKTRLVQK